MGEELGLFFFWEAQWLGKNNKAQQEEQLANWQGYLREEFQHNFCATILVNKNFWIDAKTIARHY